MSSSIMKLHTLKRSKWIVSKSKRLGRGNGSWKGNYSTKGLKWQKARSGSWMKPFFEWGQTSIVQRIPKARWFKRYFKLIKDVEIVNLGALELDDRITDWMEITKSLLKDLSYINNIDWIIKILANWDYTKKLTFVDITLFSKSAKSKIDNQTSKKSAAKVVSEDVEAPQKDAVEAKPAKKPAAKTTTKKAVK